MTEQEARAEAQRRNELKAQQGWRVGDSVWMPAECEPGVWTVEQYTPPKPSRGSRLADAVAYLLEGLR
jgi:hypothetical protein